MKCKRAAIANIKRGSEQVNWDNQVIKRNVHKFLVSCSKHGIKPVPLLDYVPYKPQNTCLIDVPTFYHKGPFWMTDNLKYKLILEIIFIKRISAIKD